jgi:hypothetical protein
MALRVLRLSIVAFAVSTAILAFVFSVVATTSHRWAIRDYYNTVVPEDWTTVNYTLSRSPFRICTATPVFRQNAASADEGPTLIFVKYNVNCSSFKPFGKDKTSCELRSVTKSDTVATDGDSRLCQQIHAAGNYAIASTVMISLGFLIVLGLALIGVTKAFGSSPTADESISTTARPASKGEAGATANTVNTSASAEQRSRLRTSRSLFQGMHLCSTIFWILGAILGLISQFYGILGLVQSAPNNADWASSAAGNSKDVNTNVEGYHGPWYQGSGLGAYLTCAWAFALVTPFLTSRLWAMPQWWDLA